MGRRRRARHRVASLRGASRALIRRGRQGVRAKTDAERRARRAATLQRYAESPRGKYRQHKQNAKKRGIAFELSFAQWLDVWKRSGHWDERGNKTGAGYVMARHGDAGAYADGNVSIITHAENVAERNTLYWERPSFVGAAARHRAQFRPTGGEPGPDVPF